MLSSTLCRSSRRTRWWGSAPSWPPTPALDTCTTLSTPRPPQGAEQHGHALVHPARTSLCWRCKSVRGERTLGRVRPNRCRQRHSLSETCRAGGQAPPRLQGPASTFREAGEHVARWPPSWAGGRAPPGGPSATPPPPGRPPWPSWQPQPPAGSPPLELASLSCYKTFPTAHNPLNGLTCHKNFLLLYHHHHCCCCCCCC